jgi:chromosome segregation ATPase
MSAIIPELWGILAPVVTATLVAVGGAFAVRRYAGPAQAQYTSAIEGRVKLLMQERDDCKAELEKHAAELEAMRRAITDLERQVRELTAEALELRRDAQVRSSTSRRPASRA